MYDCAVIGAGWAGLAAARTAASRGLKVCLVEKSLLGGTCLNAGCIPTKALVQSAKLLVKTRKAKEFGITADNVGIDISVVMQRTERIVAGLRRAIQDRLRGIELLTGHAEILGKRTIKVGNAVIEAATIILCTGSEPRALKGLEFDGVRILSSGDALKIAAIPSRLLIIGGGSIGCEFASIFSAFGSTVTVAEACDRLIPGTDADIARKLAISFKKRGITVVTGAAATALDRSAFDAIIVSVGRNPGTGGIERAGIAVENGRIAVDEYLQSSVPGIYAAGDCTGKLMLAHYAAFQGRIAALNAAGEKVPCGPVAVPTCIFTSPEIACVGLSEEEAAQQGIAVEKYQFDFLGSGMASVMGETEGMIKIIADKLTGVVVGACVIGPNGCELGGTLTLAVQSAMTVAQLKGTLFAHPSLTESISDMLQ
jgi:dihydrolipoamide dehydrogenase